MARAAAIVLIALAGWSFQPSSSIESTTVQPNDNQHAAGTLRDGVLLLHLEIVNAAWRHESDAPEMQVQAFREVGHDAQAPGLLIRVPEGTRVDVTVDNRIDRPASIHGWHERPGAESAPVTVAARGTTRHSFRVG